MKKKIIYNLSPFNNCMEISPREYIIKKLLAFGIIYCSAAILGEGIIIGILYGMGYDPLHGLMPTGVIADLLPYYGFSVFLLMTVLYCKFVEKKTLKSIGVTNTVMGYLLGMFLAIFMLLIIVILSCFMGALEFCNYNTNSNILYLIFWFWAFVIQSTTEEFMCRGFLLQSLRQKTPMPVAIIISSTAFAFPHFFTLFEANLEYAVIGSINLYLISAIFSLLVIIRSDIWMACGLHSIWNFVLYGIMGLSLSGSEQKTDSIFQFCIKEPNILNGAEYGIEASIITTGVLSVLTFVLIKKWKGKVSANGIQQ